jgi:hypothetical protein
MNGRKTVIGLAVLCALAISAFAASSASANTAFLCSKSAEVKDKVGAHCLDIPGTKEWGHVKIEKNVKTTITGTNANTAEETKTARSSKLRGTAAGVETEVICTTVSGNGSMENKEEGATMWAEGTGTINYSGCSVSKPAGKGCVVTGGVVNTKELKATTKGLTNQLLFTPASGTEFASVTISSCSVAGLNNTFPVTGEIKGTTEGGTTTSTHTGTTEQNTLKFAGQKAGLDGAITIKEKEKVLALAIT